LTKKNEKSSFCAPGIPSSGLAKAGGFWQIKMIFMRIRTMFLAPLFPAVAAAFFPGGAAAAGGPGAVALQYHFDGTANLAGNTNFDIARKIFSLPHARRFQDLVLDRLAGVFWNALHFEGGANPSEVLRPLLDDLLQTESQGSFGGTNGSRMDFVLAARLNDNRAQAWQKGLEKALRGNGKAWTENGFSGRIWNRPGNYAFWMLRAGDWLVAGRGDGLQAIRSDYLQHIRQENRPRPVMKESWLGAEVDWPLLAAWAPLSNSPFKLARTIVDVTASGGRFHATAHVSYPDAVPWQSQPWRIPKELVGSPLSSFAAARDLEVFLAPDQRFSRLDANPLTNQFIFWALREMPLQTCAAWPVADATNALRKLGAEAPAALNPTLQTRDRSQLAWRAKETQLVWSHLQLTAPTLQGARARNGDFLVANLFPMPPKEAVPPGQLWSQFEGRDNLVYYGWELTGLRLMQWRLLTEILPIYPPPTPAQVAREQQAAQAAKSPQTAGKLLSPLFLTDAWLGELTPFLGNTVTEVTRTSPRELTVVRNSPFLFSGLELVLLSHWLADAPMGPIDYNLLPRAKMTGPGLPH
jgi:hypothetical protein